jgi:hypothetical protein
MASSSGLACRIEAVAPDQFHVRIIGFHIVDQRRHAQVMIALARIFQHGILAGIAHLLDDFLGGKLGFGQVVGGHIARAIGIG